MEEEGRRNVTFWHDEARGSIRDDSAVRRARAHTPQPSPTARHSQRTRRTRRAGAVFTAAGRAVSGCAGAPSSNFIYLLLALLLSLSMCGALAGYAMCRSRSQLGRGKASARSPSPSPAGSVVWRAFLPTDYYTNSPAARSLPSACSIPCAVCAAVQCLRSTSRGRSKFVVIHLVRLHFSQCYSPVGALDAGAADTGTIRRDVKVKEKTAQPQTQPQRFSLYQHSTSVSSPSEMVRSPSINCFTARAAYSLAAPFCVVCRSRGPAAVAQRWCIKPSHSFFLRHDRHHAPRGKRNGCCNCVFRRGDGGYWPGYLDGVNTPVGDKTQHKCRKRAEAV